MKYLFEVLANPDYPPERYAEAWVEASEIIQRAAGARGTFLHRDLNNPRRLLAIAHWASKAARDASASMEDERMRAIIEAQAQHCTIKLIGEFAEPEWTVLPDSRAD